MRLVVISLCLAVLGACVWLSGCSDKPAEPPPPEPQDYAFVAFSDRQVMYTYHPLTQELDSVPVPYLASIGATASPDGKRLYLVYWYNLSVYVGVLDAESLELITQLSYYAQEPVAVSPDNQLMAIVGNNLYIVRTSDFSEVYRDTTAARGGVFSADSKSFYCSSGGRACRLDLSGSEVVKTTWNFGGGMVAHVVPTPDEELMFVYNHGAASVLSVYDAAAESVVWADTLLPGYGMVTVTPDGRYAFYNNPGGQFGSPSDFLLRVFDVAARELVAEIPTGTDFDDSLPLMYLPTDRMQVSPDSRWLVLLDNVSRVNMLLFDIKNMRFIDYVLFGASVSNLTALTET